MIYVLLADGFEETEAIAPIDLLRRAKLSVCTVSITGTLAVRGSHGITVQADCTSSELGEPNDIELLLLPGGMPGTSNLFASPVVHSLLKKALVSDAYIAAICAAPMILGELGLLKGKSAVCYPGFEQHLHGATLAPCRSVCDGKIITAAGAGAAVDFALLIIEQLCGKSVAENIKHGIIA